MYPSLKDVRGRRTGAASDGAKWWRPAVTANVAFLGLTSLFTDVSSEMVNSVVPLFLTFRLGFSRLQLGRRDAYFQGGSASQLMTRLAARPDNAGVVEGHLRLLAGAAVPQAEAEKVPAHPRC